MQYTAEENAYARWSTEEEIMSFLHEINLEENKPHPGGIPLFADSESVFIDASDTHTLVVGSTSRSRGIRFCLIVQSLKQLEAKYGIFTESIKGNCENWIILHSRERDYLNEIIELCGKISDHGPLVSMTLLQTLDKSKGEAFVMHKRQYPFIARLPDIDFYHDIETNKKKPRYPINKRKVDAVFNFNDFCYNNGDFFISKLFMGYTFEEIREICAKDEERYYIAKEG